MELNIKLPKFKAKTLYEDKWIEGDLIQGENSYIVPKEEMYYAVATPSHISVGCSVVKKDTICMSTGYNDKNGREIFFGDIVKCYGSRTPSDGQYRSKFDGYVPVYIIVTPYTLHNSQQPCKPVNSYQEEYNESFIDIEKYFEPKGKEVDERHITTWSIKDYVYFQTKYRSSISENPDYHWGVEVVSNIYEDFEEKIYGGKE